MIKKFIVIGCGGREHAIVRALGRTYQGTNDLEIYCVGTWENWGIQTSPYVCSNYVAKSILSYEDIEKGLPEPPAIVIVGPEAPLAAGLVDEFLKRGYKCIGPTAALAQIETSKVFTRQLLDKDPELRKFSPRWTAITREWSDEMILEKLYEVVDHCGGFVVKADGLRGGKGVKIYDFTPPSLEADSPSLTRDEKFQEGLSYVRECLEKDSHVLIEECLHGREFSLMGLSDGRNLFHFPVVQDYKRCLSGDRGPNTGGMGAISYPSHSLPWLNNAHMVEAMSINLKVLALIQQKYPSDPYIGIIYGSFMLTDEGLKVIEYNARFGDPEVLNIMHLLETDLSEIFNRAVEGELHELSTAPIFRKEYCLTRYAVPTGYPENPKGDCSITFYRDDRSESIESELLHASLERTNAWKTSMSLHRYRMLGSRAFAITRSIAPVPSTARLLNETLSDFIKDLDVTFDNIVGSFHYRKDIGQAFFVAEDDVQKEAPTQEQSTPTQEQPKRKRKKQQKQKKAQHTMTYEDAGVNIDEANLAVELIKPLVKGIGGFGGTLPLDRYLNRYGSQSTNHQAGPNSGPIATGMELVASMDGVGTKVQTLLNLLPRDAAFYTLGKDLLASNLNDILCTGRDVRPLFFLDYFGCRQLLAQDLYQFVRGLSDACKANETLLLGGETAELPDFSRDWSHWQRKSGRVDTSDETTQPVSTKQRKVTPHYEMVGTVVGCMRSESRFDPAKIRVGDVVLGLPSSGPHTNGYSLINKLITSGRFDPTPYPEICAPHRCYYKELSRLARVGLSITEGLSDGILGIAHITGGGLIDNPPRILPERVKIEWSPEWKDPREMPRVFRALQEAGNLSDHELLRTFNCGIGLIMVVRSGCVPLIQAIIPELRRVGTIVAK